MERLVGKTGGAPSVMIATPLEEELVREIALAQTGVEVLYEPDLLPPPRYPSDHRGDTRFRREASGERRWQEMLDRTEVLFGIPGDSGEGLADVVRRAPGLRWVQATSAGAGEKLGTARLRREELDRVLLTTASGVHATPLAEFCLFGLLAFTKSLPRLLSDQEQRRWDHYPTRELKGKTILIVGLGKIGLEVARLAHCFGMRTVGLKRRVGEGLPNVDEVRDSGDLKQVVPHADAVIVTLPSTDDTQGMIDKETIHLMNRDCIFVNVGRGSVVDEDALIEALTEERIRGAVLDVFREEPLPPDSRLWELPNVLISPHTAALAEAENERIVRLFIENLSRYLDGAPLLNRVDPEGHY